MIKNRLKSMFKYYKRINLLYTCQMIRKSKEKFNCNCICILNTCLEKTLSIIMNSQTITINRSRNNKLFMKQSSTWTTSKRISIHCHPSTINSFSSWSTTSTATKNLSQTDISFLQMKETQPAQRSFVWVFFCSFYLSL